MFLIFVCNRNISNILLQIKKYKKLHKYIIQNNNNIFNTLTEYIK